MAGQVVRHSHRAHSTCLTQVRRTGASAIRHSRLTYNGLTRNFTTYRPRSGTSLGDVLHGGVTVVASCGSVLSTRRPCRRCPRVVHGTLRRTGTINRITNNIPTVYSNIARKRSKVRLSLLDHRIVTVSTTIKLSRGVFSNTLFLNIYSGVIPNLAVTTLSFNRLPTIFIPSKPVTDNLPGGRGIHVHRLCTRNGISHVTLLRSRTTSCRTPKAYAFCNATGAGRVIIRFVKVRLPNSSFIRPSSPLHSTLATTTTHRIAHVANGNGR